MPKTSPNGTRYCRTCGFADCPGARGGLCPRWPAAAPMDLVPRCPYRDYCARMGGICQCSEGSRDDG